MAEACGEGGEARGNLWRHTARERVSAPALDCDAVCDIVIVGGGFTGCSAALHAAEAGLSVRLLEAHEIAYGGSGRNVGLVNAGLWLPPDDVRRKLGSAAGDKLNQTLAAAPDHVFSLIERHGIDCEGRRAGTLHCAHAPSGLRDLRNRQRQLAEMGAPVTLLSADETAARTGSSRFCGALHDARAGTIQPRAYCVGLALAAQRADAVLHEASPVASISRQGSTWIVRTAKGRVSSRGIVVATNAYHREISGCHVPKTVPVSYFQMATRPLSANLRRTVLPGGEGCWDTATVMSSFRTDAEGRLIIGGIGGLHRPGGGIHKAWARRKLAQLFPHLSDEPFEHAWFGRISMSADHLPKILRLGPNGYAVFGYSGRGIAPGTAFGRAMALAFAHGDEEVLPLRPVDTYSERLTKARALYYELGASAWHLASSRDVQREGKNVRRNTGKAGSCPF